MLHTAVSGTRYTGAQQPPHPVPLPIRWGEGEPFTRLVAVWGIMLPFLRTGQSAGGGTRYTGAQPPPHPVPLPIQWGEGEPFMRLVAVWSIMLPILRTAQ
jgi:hypothetical protein